MKSGSEFSRIERIKIAIGKPSSRVVTGIGDDAAVVEAPSGQLLLCTDAMVEGVHFDLAYCSPGDLGHKALAACLSDIAAMNGVPLHAMFSIALPKTAPVHFLDEFYAAATELSKELKIDIVGGDLSSSPGTIFIDAVCVGQTDTPIKRSGAKPGDWLAVSGFPGASAAGLAALQNLHRSEVPSDLARAHLRPRPRFDLLKTLAPMCTSLIDVSDGLASEIHHLAQASKIGFAIEAIRFPVHPNVLALASHLNHLGKIVSPIEWALSGGEDYELLATLDPAKVEANGGPPRGFTIIGHATRDGVTLLNADGTSRPISSTGFDHFASS